MDHAKNINIPAPPRGGYYEIWRIAYPLVIMSASHTVMQFCDRMFLAMRSTQDVAAALPAGILMFTSFSFFTVTINFTSALVAQHFGRGDKDACIRAVWNGFYLALIIAVPLLTVIPFICLSIISASGHAPELIARERTFYTALIPSSVFVCLSGAFFAYFSGQGKTWYVSVTNLGACILNIILDYILIFGKLGFPEMGIMGAGIATSVSTGISFTAAITMFLTQNQKLFPTRARRAFCAAEIKKLLRFGTPAGLQCFIDVGAFTLFCFLIGRISEAAMAASTIVCSINMISFLPMLGVADATAILVGQLIGAGDKAEAEKTAYRAWRMASLYMLIASAVFVLFPGWLAGKFAPNGASAADFAAIAELVREFLICAAVYNFFDAAKFIFMGALRGSGDTRASMLISVILILAVWTPGLLLITIIFHVPALGVWIFATCYLLLEAYGMLWRFRTGAWKKIRLTGGGEKLSVPAAGLEEPEL
jgi:MATE family multidrug resistance protein